MTYAHPLIPQPEVPDDGTSPPVYASNFDPLADIDRRLIAVEAETKRLSISAVAVESHSGIPEQHIFTVREELPRGGFMHHDIAVYHDGFGHYQVTNMDANSPHHTSLANAKNHALKVGKFEGKVSVGKMTDKGWEPE